MSTTQKEIVNSDSPESQVLSTQMVPFATIPHRSSLYSPPPSFPLQDLQSLSNDSYNSQKSNQNTEQILRIHFINSNDQKKTKLLLTAILRIT